MTRLSLHLLTTLAASGLLAGFDEEEIANLIEQAGRTSGPAR